MAADEYAIIVFVALGATLALAIATEASSETILFAIVAALIGPWMFWEIVIFEDPEGRGPYLLLLVPVLYVLGRCIRPCFQEVHPIVYWLVFAHIPNLVLISVFLYLYYAQAKIQYWHQFLANYIF